MSDLNYLIFDSYVHPDVLSNLTMCCVGQLIPDGTMLSFTVRPDIAKSNKLKEDDMLLDCCKLYSAIVENMPQYKGWYGHIQISPERVHYVENFKTLEKELNEFNNE